MRVFVPMAVATLACALAVGANAAAQQTVNQSATNARNNVSGVNLDEEAAKMLQFQQAYQACAQMIQTSNTVFQTLISSIQHG